MAHSRSLQDLAFRRTRNRLLVIQVVLIAVAAGIAFPMKGMVFGLALLYGGAISIAATLVGAWRLQVATDDATHESALPGSTPGLGGFYSSALLRFLTVVALLAIGLGLLGLHGLALLTGFVVTQSGLLFARPVKAR